MQSIDFAELDRISAELDAEKPYFELIDGIELQKTNGTYTHGRLQVECMTILHSWAAERGEVGIEWRFWLVPNGVRRTGLVPDIAYVSEGRMQTLEGDAIQMPPFAPDIVVEIRADEDRLRNLQRKIDLYFAHGSRLVLDVDPKTRIITAYDRSGTREFRTNQRFEHPEAPGLTFEVGALFASTERRRKA